MRKVSVYRYDRENGEQEITSQAAFESSNPAVATVDATGKISSVSSGSAEITCTYNGESAKIAVDVYVPLYTAADMDKLALVTYEREKAEAEKLLAQNYLLMNDIDYSTHVRNYILPIASPTIEDIYAVIARQNSVSGDCSYFSFAWKKILGLTQKTIVDQDSAGNDVQTNVQILEKADGTPFKGVNPNAVKFTGIFDGNGYSIKNAWLMLDNVLYLNGITSQYTGYTAGANCFIGYNSGTLRNLSFTDFTIGNSHDQLVTLNEETNELEDKYTYFSNSMWSGSNEYSMTFIYRSGKIPGEQVEDGVTYESEIYKTRITAGFYRPHYIDKEINGRTDWQTRPNAASALVFLNAGTVENVYVDYFNSYNTGLGINAGTLVTQNDTTGSVKNCLVVAKVQLSDARPETKFNPAAVVNNGLLENVTATVEVYKRTDYALYGVNFGTVRSCESYFDKASFMENSKNLDKFDAVVWNKANMTLNSNLYGFTG